MAATTPAAPGNPVMVSSGPVVVWEQPEQLACLVSKEQLRDASHLTPPHGLVLTI